ncbi:uncharacterized protein LOC134763235 [Penaeus indicus]|uniref:uncharacterized protein LOC134763235 n=1 Tax=Penaeus indicus TaxID=29960 RepID=UPI00300CA1FE
MTLRRESKDGERLRVKMKVPEEAPCDECRRSRLLPALLAEARSQPADCGNAPSPPPWLHREKFAIGQAVFQRYFLGIFVSNLVGLLCLLTVETIVRVLAFTGRSSMPSTSYKRYLSTINHLRQWYSSDVFIKESSAYKSIQLVRRMHTSTHFEAQKLQKCFTSQADMVVTQWAFFGLVLTQGSQFGVQLTREEEEGLVHFWRIIGYLLGIEEKYNLAKGSIEDVKTNCHALVHKIIIPGLVTPPPEFHQMADAMLHGIHLIVPVMDPPAFTEFTKCIFGIGYSTSKLSWHSRFIFNTMKWNFSTLLHIPVLNVLLRVYENFLLTFALFICNSLPVIRSYYTWIQKKVSGLWQDIKESFMNIIKGILLLFNLESS